MSKISKATKVDCDISYNSIHKSFILGNRDLLLSGWQIYFFATYEILIITHSSGDENSW